MTTSVNFDIPIVNVILDSMDEAVVGMDDSGRIVLINNAAEELFGYRYAELIGKSIEILVPEHARARQAGLIKRINATMDENTAVSSGPKFRVQCKDGSELSVKTSISKIAHAGQHYLLAIITDQRSRQRQALAKSATDNAQRVAQVGSWDWNLDTGEVSLSDEGWRIYGTDPNAAGATADRLLAAVHNEDRQRVIRTVNTAVRERKPFELVHRLQRADGEIRIVFERGEPFYDESGDPAYMSGTILDITEKSEIEEQLRQARKLESMGKLAGTVAHDFNNLLMVIMGNLDLLQYDVSDRPSSAKLVEDAMKAAERGAELTQQLLTSGRRTTGHRSAK